MLTGRTDRAGVGAGGVGCFVLLKLKFLVLDGRPTRCFFVAGIGTGAVVTGTLSWVELFFAGGGGTRAASAASLFLLL